MKFCHCVLFFSSLFLVHCFYNNVYCASIVGLLDDVNSDADWGRLGGFTFSIPPETRGTVETDVVVGDAGHMLLLLTEEDERFVLSYPGLHRFDVRKRTSVRKARRRLLGTALLEATTEGNAHHQHTIRVLAAANETSTRVPAPQEPSANATNVIQVAASQAPAATALPHTVSASLPAAHPVGVPRLEVIETQSSGHVAPGVVHPATASVSELAANSSVASIRPASGFDDELRPAAQLGETKNISESVIVIQPAHTGTTLRATSVCEALIEISRVSETLRFMGPRLAYHAVLLVEPHMSHRRITAVVTRCNSVPFVPYKLVFKNPGGFLKAHFSYEDQGLLELFAVALAVCCFLIYWHRDLYARTPSHAQKEHPVVNVVFLATVSFLVYLVLEFLHLLTYAFDGTGLAVFQFLGSLAEVLFTVAAASALPSLLAHLQPSLTRSADGPKEDSLYLPSPTVEHEPVHPFCSVSGVLQHSRRFFQNLVHAWTSVQTLLYILLVSLFLVTLGCSFRYPSFPGSLTPGHHFFHLTEFVTLRRLPLLVCSVGYFLARIQLACLIIKRTAQSLRHNASKITHSTMNAGFLLASSSVFWLLSLPVVALFCRQWTFFPHIQLTAMHASNIGICTVLWKCIASLQDPLRRETLPGTTPGATPGPYRPVVSVENQQLVPPSSGPDMYSETASYTFTTGDAAAGGSYPNQQEPDLIDITQHHRTVSSVFAYTKRP